MKINLTKEEYLRENQKIFKNKKILDLACHSGESTSIIAKYDPVQIIGVDIRKDKIELARQSLAGNTNIRFLVGDVTDRDLIPPLVEQSDVITFFGALYHLFDHFRFFSYILKPHVEYVLIESLFGPETQNPEMFWGFEETNDPFNGWIDEHTTIAHGTPNLSWIIQSAEIFGFSCDWVQSYAVKRKAQRDYSDISLEDYDLIKGPDWPEHHVFINLKEYPDFIRKELDEMVLQTDLATKRMVFRLYNTRLVESVPLKISDVYIWENNQSM